MPKEQIAEFLHKYFYIFQIVFGAIALSILFLLFSKAPKSNFRVREADLRKPGKPGPIKQKHDQDLAKAKIEKKKPYQLAGIRIDGRPHEILNIQANAPKADIEQAYRDLMKQYHPDKIGRPGSREWKDAQTIAGALNHAKDEMLKRFKR